MADDTICNMCGLTCVIGPEDSPATGPCGLIGAEVSGGYESTPGNGYGALDDCTSYRFSMCEYCLDWLFSQFQVPPAVFCSIDQDEEPWRPALIRVQDDEYRKWKALFLSESERHTKARKQ